MKKRLLTLALAICVLAPVTLSARAFDFNLGATAQYQNVVDGAPSQEDLQDIDNYRFGAEARLNFLLLEVTDTALFGSSSDDIEFTNHLTGGVYIDLINLVRVGLGVGPELGMKITDDGLTDSNGDSLTFDSVFKESDFKYKAHVDFLLGDTLTLSASYTLPSDFNLGDNFDFESIIPNGDNWEDGRVGISLLLF